MEAVSEKRKSQEVESARTNAKRVTISMIKENSEEISSLLIESGIPLELEVIDMEKLYEMCAKIDQVSPRLELPKREDLEGKLMKQRVAKIKEVVDEHVVWWRKTGCSILIDCRTNRRTEKTICNFFVSSCNGVVFLKSVDATEFRNDVDRKFKMVDEVVEEIGEESVVQVIANDLENFRAVGKMLMEKRKKIWFTPCVAHCIGLMLQDFAEKLELHKATIANGKKITSYVYSRDFTTAMLHHFSKGNDLVKPGVTKSATSYLTLGCLMDNKEVLRKMFNCDQWKSSYYAGTKSGKDVVNLVMDSEFWKNVRLCLKAANPLIKVLHSVTSDDKRAMMGYIYNEMDLAKEEIRRDFNNVKRRYMPLLDIIDGRWEEDLFRPLHATAYYLNPHFHYRHNFQVDIDVKLGLYCCLARMVPNKNDAYRIYKNAKKTFGCESEDTGIQTKNPTEWWEIFGSFLCPEPLKLLAVRILNLTCCSSGYIRNWSAFDKLHAKRRNHLKQKLMKDTILVMSNSKLAKRKQAGNADEYTIHDLSSDDEWITETDEIAYDKELELAPDDDTNLFVPNGDDAHEDQAGGYDFDSDSNDDNEELDDELDDAGEDDDLDYEGDNNMQH